MNEPEKTFQSYQLELEFISTRIVIDLFRKPLIAIFITIRNRTVLFIFTY